MKIFKTFMKLSALAAVVLGMVACGGDGNGGAKLATKDNMIPDDAVVAIKVMPEQLWEKAMGDPESKISRMVSRAKFNVDMSSASLGEFGELVSEVMNDPAALGVALDEPVVLSVSADLEKIAVEKASLDLCMVAVLDDQKSFVSFIDTAIEFVEENGVAEVTKSKDGGYTHYKLFAENGVYVDLGVTSGTAIFRFSYDTISKSKNLKKSMAKLFADGGPKNAAGLADFYAAKSDVAVWSDVAGVIETLMPAIEMSGEFDVKMLEEYMPMYEDASMVSTLDFYDGQTVVKIQSYGSEEMVARAMKYNEAASGKYFKFLPASSVFVANIAIKDFPGLVDELCKTNPDYKEALGYLEESLGIDEELLAGFPGLVTVALDGTGIGKREVPGFVLYMECGQNVWDFVSSYLEQVADLAGPNQYCINDVCYVTYNGSAIVLVEAETLRRNYAGGTPSFASTPLAQQIAKGGFVFNIEALPSYLLDSVAENGDYYMTGGDLLEYLNSVVVTASDDFMASTITLNMGDKEHNMLEKVLEFVASQVAF